MNIKKQHYTINTALVMSGLMLIFYSYSKLYLNSQDTVDGTRTVGFLRFYQNDIRLKKSSQFQWEDIYKSNSEISINDRLFSNAASSATISLNSGNKLNLNEQSLIRMRSENSVLIEKGAITLDLSKNAAPLILLINNKKVSLKASTDSKVVITKGIDTSIEVKSGMVKVLQKNTSLDLLPDQKVILNKNQEISATQLLSPKGQTFFIQSEYKVIDFKYEPVRSKEDLWLSKDINFSELIPLQNKNSRAKLRPGKYFWKVNNTDAEFFQIVKEISSPKDFLLKNQTIIYTYKSSSNVKFKTSQIKEAPPLIIETFDRNMNSIDQIQLSKKSIYTQKFEVGEYFYRSKYASQFIKSGWSDKYKFTVAKKEYTLGKPLIIELSRPNQEVKFSWDKKAQDLSLFELATDQSFKSIIKSKRIRSKNFTHITFPIVGTFYWRTRKVEANGSLSAQAPIEVIIKPTPPPEKPKRLPNLKIKLKQQSSTSHYIRKMISFVFDLFIPISYAADKNEASISFPRIKDAKTYEVEIYQDKNLQKLVKRINTKRNSFTWSPKKEGQYFWRIRYTDFWKRVSEFSELSKLRIEFENNKKTETNKNIVPKKTFANSTVSFQTGPSQISFSQGKNPNIDIEGQHYNAFKINYNKPIDFYYLKDLRVSYASYAGKVFDDQDFNLRELELSSQLKVFPISALVHFKQYTQFEYNDSEVESGGTEIIYSIGSMYEKTLKVGKNQIITGNINYHLLGAQQYQLGLSYDYSYTNQLNVLATSTYVNANTNSADFDTSIQYFQLLIGLKYKLK